VAAKDERWTSHEIDQVHGAQVHEVPPTPDAAGDGLVSAARGALLVVRTADCVPVLLAAVDHGNVVAVAAAHAGWRGLVAGILPRSVAELRRIAPEARLVAAVGPSIGPCCFEVGPEVARPLRARYGDVVRPGSADRSFADLPRAATRELRALATEVPEPDPPPCTRCGAELFFSYRREGASGGRMAAFIGLVPGR
jgi:YfiH family protein